MKLAKGGFEEEEQKVSRVFEIIDVKGNERTCSLSFFEGSHLVRERVCPDYRLTTMSVRYVTNRREKRKLTIGKNRALDYE